MRPLARSLFRPVLFACADSPSATASTSRTGYVYLLFHLLSAGQRAEIFAAHNGDERQKARMHAVGASLATAGAAPLALLHSFFVPPSLSRTLLARAYLD